MRRALPAVLFLAAAAGASEIPETVAAAYQSFLEGRYSDAEKGYRYLATLGISTPDPDSNLALLARDRGDNATALPSWVKASLMESADGFLWNQRAWAALSADRVTEARRSFEKAIDRSTTTATQAEANLGIGLSFLLDSRPKGGTAALRLASQQGPYTLSAAYYLASLTALAMNDRNGAMLYLRQSLESDPWNLEAVRDLARLYDKVGENRSAWRAYHRLLGLDPQNTEAAQRVQKLAQFITGDPESSLPVRRLGRPLLDPEKETAPGEKNTVRISLFSDALGRPAAATRLYFIANAPFKLIGAGGDIVREDARPFEQWEISFRDDIGVVELRDGARNIQYTAKQPFRVEPAAPGGSVLIKSAKFPSTVGFDPSDREVRGTLEAIPTPFGVRLVNEVNLEQYLYGAVSASMPQNSPSHAYKAMAIVARTNALWHKAQAHSNLERADLCDSPRCQRYAGVNEEMRDATKAVQETEGLVLTREGRIDRVAHHENCGGRTEAGNLSGEETLKHLPAVEDAPNAGIPPRTPVQLERWTHEHPPFDRYCEAGNSPQTRSRWVRFIDAKGLRERADRIRPVGTVHTLRILKRSPSGRVTAVEVAGAEGKVEAEGEAAISSLISPNSLLSTWFTVTPVLRGGRPSHFILWGAGAGHGHGMCRAGAQGQAAFGRDFKKILSVYFPHMKVEHLLHKSESASASSPVNPRTGHKKPKNPKRKKP